VTTVMRNYVGSLIPTSVINVRTSESSSGELTPPPVGSSRPKTVCDAATCESYRLGGRGSIPYTGMDFSLRTPSCPGVESTPSPGY
jgi:hypothetical protein